MCVADEHYTATLLNAYFMEESVDHLGRLTFTNWARGGWHPETFYPGNVTEYIVRMRTSDGAERCAAPPCVTHILWVAATRPRDAGGRDVGPCELRLPSKLRIVVFVDGRDGDERR